MRRAARRLCRRLGIVATRPGLEAIAASGLFDRAGYLARYPDVAAIGVDPLLHYLDAGALEGRNPCDLFDSAYYLGENPDVAASGINPLAHFCDFGWKESRHPSPDFDVDWYLQAHLAHAKGQLNPLVHYLTAGRAMGLEIRTVRDPGIEHVRASGVFDHAYYLEHYPDVAGTGIDPIVHYFRHGAEEGRNPSAMFETNYYLDHNPDVARAGTNPLLHFCQTGWKELRNPGRGFDVWWYWSTHLDPAIEGCNPLGHYQAVGRDLGLDPRPPARASQLAGSGYRHPDRPLRRICLFAGYDRDGIVDDYVLAYVAELARHADVYYLADCRMRDGELDKLAPHVRAAWSQPHGKYDFGSYSELVRRIGWKAISEYDELLLVNDSCYLLRPLDTVFSAMDGRACDWWGLQATKGIAATRSIPDDRSKLPIPMEAVRGGLLDSFEQEYQYDFHVGSYFVAARKPVIGDPGFRKMLDSVAPQDTKKSLVLKYEVGLTRYLVARGHAFDTFVTSLYPFHPLFTNWYFCLLDEGFPLLKRYLLAENHYGIPHLHDWADRIRARIPDARTDVVQKNLERVVCASQLHGNLHVGDDRPVDDDPPPKQLLDDEAFRAADRASPKHAAWWAFPVCAFTGVFSGNERAVFECVKDDPRIRKTVLTRGKPVEADGANVEVLPLESPMGQHRLMRAGNIFIKHSPTRNLVFPVAGDLHNIINLWHGIPFKKIGYASLDVQGRLDKVAAEHARCRAVISSSRIDAMAMAAAFYPLPLAEVWNTGLPRNDFILRPIERLPIDMQRQAEALRGKLRGRRLVLFMPTFRNAQDDAAYRFDAEEKSFLKDWLARNNAVLGVREHMAAGIGAYRRQFEDLDCIDLPDEDFPNVEVLYRISSALVTDYSSCFIDYMLTGKPAVSFAHDYERYLLLERGAFYDLEFVFPGDVCRDFAQLRVALERIFDARTPEKAAEAEWKRQLFFDHVDDMNAARVVAKVKQLAGLGEIGRPLQRDGTGR
jgi:CDP-glycerol glycerophosphotransferase (TagB/SpsB family)